jgi:predicted transcriptional regulator of viral defense system
MIKTTAILMEELKEYVNPTAKIRRLVNKGELIPVTRGLYETDSKISGHVLASIIYGPSYLSFEYALSYYSLIPEAVYIYTSATFEKRKEKRYSTPYGVFTYRDVPIETFPLDIILVKENGYGFKIATPEKAVCDQLYKSSPLSNNNELESLLFEDLRIDKEEFFLLNLGKMHEISTYYHTQNHKLLRSFIKRSIKHGSNR